MPRWNVPKLTQGGVIVILVASTGAALTWLAQAPGLERGARGPDLPAPPAPPALDTPDPFPAPAVPAAPAPPLPDAAHPAAADSDLAGTEPVGPAPDTRAADANDALARDRPCRLLPDARDRPAACAPPGRLRVALPGVDRLELICFHEPGGPAHLAVMQAADGRLFHWGEERRFLQEHLRADGIDSREIRTVADPGAFLEPLRAAAHAACERSLRGANAPHGPE